MNVCPLFHLKTLSEEDQLDEEERYFDSIYEKMNGATNVYGPPNYGFIDTPESDAQLVSLRAYWESPEGLERLAYHAAYDADHPWEAVDVGYRSYELSKQKYEAGQKKNDESKDV